MKSFFCALGQFGSYTASVGSRLFQRSYSPRELLVQMHRIGVESLTVVNLCAFSIGLVMVVQTAHLLSRFNAEAHLSGIITTSFVREIGPVFAAIMFAGRIGTGIAAELGSMVVTEQIDAYRVFGTDPIAKLAVPRVIATAVMLPALTVIACVVGVFSGFLVSVFDEGIPGKLFVETAAANLTRLDVIGCLAKGTVFGLVIGLVATHIGLRTRRATEAVGDSATRTMVFSVLGVLLADLILTKMLLSLAEYRIS